MAPGGVNQPTERQVQRAILAMCGTCFPRVLIHHSPNGAQLAGNATARFKQIGALKGDGFKVGFPDLLCLWPGPRGAFMEVKRAKGGVLSDAQKAMHEQLNAIGWPCKVVRSPEEAYDFLKELGAPWNGIPWGVA
jgi:hypothetical protein